MYILSDLLTWIGYVMGEEDFIILIDGVRTTETAEPGARVFNFIQTTFLL